MWSPLKREGTWGGWSLPVRWSPSASGALLLLLIITSVSWTGFKAQCPRSYGQNQISGSGNTEWKGETLPWFHPVVFYVFGGCCCWWGLGRKGFLPFHIVLPAFWRVGDTVILMNGEILEAGCISVELWHCWYSLAWINGIPGDSVGAVSVVPLR